MNWTDAYAAMKKGKEVWRPEVMDYYDDVDGFIQRPRHLRLEGNYFRYKNKYGEWSQLTYISIFDLDATDWEIVE